MKVLKQTLTLFALLGVFSTAAFAQTENANVDVTATVQAALTLTPTAVQLGTIEPAASVLDANGNDTATETNVGTGAAAGALQIQGTTGIDIDITYTGATLANGNGTTVAFTPSVYLGTNAVASGTAVTLAGGDITLDIGGSLAAPTESGSYSTANAGGTPIQFDVTYN